MAKLLFPALGNPSPCTGHLVGIAVIPETRTVLGLGHLSFLSAK